MSHFKITTILKLTIEVGSYQVKDFRNQSILLLAVQGHTERLSRMNAGLSWSGQLGQECIIYDSLSWSSTWQSLKSTRRQVSGTSVRGYLVWGEKTQPKAGQHHPMGWGPELNKIEKEWGSDSICLSISWLKAWCELPLAPPTMANCAPELWAKIPTPFLKFPMSGILSQCQWNAHLRASTLWPQKDQ